MIVELHDKIFAELAQVIAQQKAEAYVVGGFVRDIFLKRDSKDVDIVVLGDGIELAKAFADSRREKTEFAFFKNFGTAMVKTGGWDVEFVGARKESYASHSRKPTVEPGSLTDDLNRRDLTINAMAVSLNKRSKRAYAKINH